ncbi:uncharacterized protein [Arachis hypogaea]|uniref:uncharacterized protein n=1 Tax=Arachis hypogaea TaxID=3818 RepID=UPI003B2196E9
MTFSRYGRGYKKVPKTSIFFTLLNGTLYRRGFTRPLLKCLTKDEADIALSEAHENLKVRQHFASIEHPQTNGLAEAANKVILYALKKKLDDAKRFWAELIPKILWGYNTTPQSSTKETPFRLVYVSEAMIPLEISQTFIRTQLGHQDETQRAELDIIEEIRDTRHTKQ